MTTVNFIMNPSGSSGHLLKRIQFFTWLRGIAAYFVILSHSTLATQGTYLNEQHANNGALDLFFNSISLGGFGVTLFFVLSGCTLFLIYHQMQGARDFGKFYLKRFMRIYPAFAVSLLAYLLFRPIFQSWYIQPQGFWVERQFLASLDVKTLFEYFSFTFNFLDEHTVINNAYWSLPVEFQFYLLFPVLLLANRCSPYIGPIVFCGLTYFVARYFHVPGLTLERVWEFAAGMLIGYLALLKPGRISLRTFLAIGILSVAGSALTAATHVRTLPGAPDNLYNGLLAIIVVWAALSCSYSMPDGRLSRFLDNYGEISYSTYLYHNLFVGIAVLVCIHVGITGAYKFLFILPFVTVAAFYTAIFSYQFVEKPGIRLGKNLTKSKSG